MPAPNSRRRRMTAHAWEPLTMTWGEVAFAVFRASELWLRGHVGDYDDFPKARDDLFSRKAIEEWCDRHWHLSPPTAANEAMTQDDVAQLLKTRIENGFGKGPASRRKAA